MAWRCVICGAAAAIRCGRCPECGNYDCYLPATSVAVYRPDVQVLTTRELYGHRDRELRLEEPWRSLLGSVPEGDGWLSAWWGLPGSGKSTALLRLLHEVAGEGIFVSVEEGVGASLRAKVRRLELVSDRVLVTTAGTVEAVTELAREVGTTWIVWDSLTVSSLLPEDLEGLKRDGFRVSVALHSTKAGEYAGSAGVMHVVDLGVKVEGGEAVSMKNRYGEVGKRLPVFLGGDVEVDSSPTEG